MMQRVRVALCVLLAAEIGLHQDSRVARAGGVDDTCSVPPHKNHTVPFNQMEQYPEKTRLRYTCKDGYLRKAGTSSLIQCKRNGTSLWWDNVSGSVSLVCIPHPQQSPPKEANPKRTESPSTAYPSQQVETTSPGRNGTVEKHSNEVATSVAAVSAAVIVLVAFVVGIQLLIRRRRFSHLPVPQEEREFVNPTVTLHSQAAQLLNSPTDPAATNNS
ncbi:interleukin-15 receptor subunit alpha isoform X5 [Scleropages formosus]|uniref:interleukin-15 receptor subunit alpha isoform X5 n=1 Tax=Scleropages formosus TaxID=113540 RepID=UPI000878129C|nr:interleukin-15 receptor subunit alpha isoform X5 [Scleropages formosus]